MAVPHRDWWPCPDWMHLDAVQRFAEEPLPTRGQDAADYLHSTSTSPTATRSGAAHADAMERRSEAGEQIDRARGQDEALRRARQRFRMEHNEAMEILTEIERRRRRR